MKLSRLSILAAAVSAVLALPAVPPGQVLAKDPPKGTSSPQGAAALAGQSIGGNPLTVTISPDLNCAVNKVGDANGEFYGDTACGTLISADGTLYGPQSIPAGGDATPRTAFTPVSQTRTTVQGQPSTITTVVDAGSLRIIEVDSYLDGDNSYQTDVTIHNNGSAPANIRL